VLIVELRPGYERDAHAALEVLRGEVADWAIPDEVVQVAAMPIAATGKIDRN